MMLMNGFSSSMFYSCLALSLPSSSSLSPLKKYGNTNVSTNTCIHKYIMYLHLIPDIKHTFIWIKTYSHILCLYPHIYISSCIMDMECTMYGSKIFGNFHAIFCEILEIFGENLEIFRVKIRKKRRKKTLRMITAFKSRDKWFRVQKVSHFCSLDHRLLMEWTLWHQKDFSCPTSLFMVSLWQKNNKSMAQKSMKKKFTKDWIFRSKVVETLTLTFWHFPSALFFLLFLSLLCFLSFSLSLPFFHAKEMQMYFYSRLKERSFCRLFVFHSHFWCSSGMNLISRSLQKERREREGERENRVRESKEKNRQHVPG